MTHDKRTSQQLYVFAMSSPTILRNLERTFNTLSKYRELDTAKALELLLSNVKSAARLYVQSHGLTLNWWEVFEPHEREGCAYLFLARYKREEMPVIKRPSVAKAIKQGVLRL